jgi:predicted lactoylglutathione lyase
MEQRVSLVTLGVSDLGRARAFYEALGWTTGAAPAVFWGGYSGVFIDPDGHPWEIAHNPGWTIKDDGSTSLGSSNS